MLKNIVRGVAITALSLSLGLTADAKPKGGVGGNKPIIQPPGGGGNIQKNPSVQLPGNVNNKFLKGVNFKKPIKLGKPFKSSFCYKGKGFCFWNDFCWCDYLGCEIYWCPVTCHWFYFYEPDCCYYFLEECPGY
jgi:hypothetical protein